jgi:hypothetical protein
MLSGVRFTPLVSVYLETHLPRHLLRTYDVLTSKLRGNNLLKLRSVCALLAFLP